VTKLTTEFQLLCSKTAPFFSLSPLSITSRRTA